MGCPFKDVFTLLPLAVSISPLLFASTLGSIFAWPGWCLLASQRWVLKPGCSKQLDTACMLDMLLGNRNTTFKLICWSRFTTLKLIHYDNEYKTSGNAVVCTSSETRFWVPVFSAIEIACENSYLMPRSCQISEVYHHT